MEEFYGVILDNYKRTHAASFHGEARATLVDGYKKVLPQLNPLQAVVKAIINGKTNFDLKLLVPIEEQVELKPALDILHHCPTTFEDGYQLFTSVESYDAEQHGRSLCELDDLPLSMHSHSQLCSAPQFLVLLHIQQRNDPANIFKLCTICSRPASHHEAVYDFEGSRPDWLDVPTYEIVTGDEKWMTAWEFAEWRKEKAARALAKEQAQIKADARDRIRNAKRLGSKTVLGAPTSRKDGGESTRLQHQQCGQVCRQLQ